MLPHYNSFPHHSNQAHTTGSSAPPDQFQPELGVNKNQIPFPFSNSNTHVSNAHGGGAMPNMPPYVTQPNFMNLPNNFLPMQNNHLGMSQFGSFAPASHVGFFASQANATSMNSVLQGKLCNLMHNANQVIASQQPGQLFGNNMLNLPQQMNHNMGFPYGQFCLPNQLQNMNQFVPMQMQNPYQGGPNCTFSGSNQAPQATSSQNAPFLANHQFGNVHPIQLGQQVNQSQQDLVLPPLQGTQGKHTNTNGVYNSNSKWKHSPSTSFSKNTERGVQQQGGFQNSQFRRMKNAKGKLPNVNKGKGLRNESEAKFTNQGEEKKRSLSLSYTEQEIQRWREERRKHYPSKSNVEKKLSEKLVNSEVIEKEVKTRREQLKEILKKQAELGVEVAEIPPYYLADSNQGRGREENGPLTKKGRFRNKFGKREKFDRKDRFGKRHRSQHKDSPNDPACISKREPTLLEKLLGADIRRDRSHLLQVFRFMVSNSFFKDCPDKPLKFPTVAVKESGRDEDGAALAENEASNNDYEDNDDGDGEGIEIHEEEEEEEEEEEGEIIN